MEYVLPECHSSCQMGAKEMNIKDLFPSSAQFFSRANNVAAAKISCIRGQKDSLALCCIFLKQKEGKKDDSFFVYQDSYRVTGKNFRTQVLISGLFYV